MHQFAQDTLPIESSFNGDVLRLENGSVFRQVLERFSKLKANDKRHTRMSRKDLLLAKSQATEGAEERLMMARMRQMKPKPVRQYRKKIKISGDCGEGRLMMAKMRQIKSKAIRRHIIGSHDVVNRIGHKCNTKRLLHSSAAIRV